jgi:hypothetical protein
MSRRRVGASPNQAKELYFVNFTRTFLPNQPHMFSTQQFSWFYLWEIGVGIHPAKMRNIVLSLSTPVLLFCAGFVQDFVAGFQE